MPKNVKFCEARIVRSMCSPNEVSIRPRVGEDIRKEFTEAGFVPGDHIVVMSEAMYLQLLDQATRLPSQPK